MPQRQAGFKYESSLCRVWYFAKMRPTHQNLHRWLTERYDEAIDAGDFEAALIAQHYFRHFLAAINALTCGERRTPSLVRQPSRLLRIARGAGLGIQETRDYLTQYAAAVIHGQQPRLPWHIRAELCQHEHPELRRARCPWCGWRVNDRR